jgi:hypothetical protein
VDNLSNYSARMGMDLAVKTVQDNPKAWVHQAWTEAAIKATFGEHATVLGSIGRPTPGVDVTEVTRNSSLGISVKGDWEQVLQFTLLPGEKQHATVCTRDWETGLGGDEFSFFEDSVDLRVYRDNFPGHKREVADLGKAVNSLRRISAEGKEFFSARNLVIACQGKSLATDKKGRSYVALTWLVVVDVTPPRDRANSLDLSGLVRKTIAPTPEGGWKGSKPRPMAPGTSVPGKPSDVIAQMAAAADAPF